MSLEKELHDLVSRKITAILNPLAEEMGREFAEMERRLVKMMREEVDKRLRAITEKEIAAREREREEVNNRDIGF